ncbi:cupin domain-containing protein [Streptomyces sp. NBC_01352]|uniref:cupin domain-containing protein n=1 Tax=unclassified Streptomyces TaxID=2593676 RepID=UPI00224F29CE|nr:MULTISPECIES: cupin domain-containing protein [unclassified Streptomyces]MCX4703807.1 cupin domain-containing protein [Streptomyces sp. NBC_01373]
MTSDSGGTTPVIAPEETDPELRKLYDGFTAAGLIPLWTEIGNLMPLTPQPEAVPHVWPWDTLLPLARRAGDLVPVGRGGERRAIALANPGLPGRPYATPNLWAAVQYLGPREVAPAHRHAQGAFRFILEGEGVWTVVNGDAVEMRPGDLLLTPSMHWHGHHHVGDEPMVWLDGLDIPLVHRLDAGFFEFGENGVSDRSTPSRSRNERLWGHPGLRPIAAPVSPNSPLMAYRWADTDDALTAQLELEDEGHPGVIEPGHAGIRFTNPATGRDALATLRTEMHRLRAGATTATRRTVGSSVWQVFRGSGTVTLDDRVIEVADGDLIAVPSWCALTIAADTRLDLFTFNDAPVYEALDLARTETLTRTETLARTETTGSTRA